MSDDSDKHSIGNKRTTSVCVICGLPIAGIFNPKIRNAHNRCGGKAFKKGLKAIDGNIHDK